MKFSVSRLTQRLTNIPDWFKPYLVQLDDIVGELRSINNKGISLDNIDCQEAVGVRFVTSADYLSGDFKKIVLQKNTNRKYNNLILTKLQETTAPGEIVGYPQFHGVGCTDWDDTGTTIEIKFVTGLDPEKTYTANFFIF